MFTVLLEKMEEQQRDKSIMKVLEDTLEELLFLNSLSEKLEIQFTKCLQVYLLFSLCLSLVACLLVDRICGLFWYAFSRGSLGHFERFLWPARLLCSWNSSGKNTEVGSCSLLQRIVPTQGLNPGRLFTVWATRILELVAISYFRGSFQPRDQTRVFCVSCIGRWVLYHWATWEVIERTDAMKLIYLLLGSNVCSLLSAL